MPVILDDDEVEIWMGGDGTTSPTREAASLSEPSYSSV